MTNYSVKRIPGKLGKIYIRVNHYTHSCHNGPMCWGLYEGEELIGVIAFATPCSENVRASIFGPDHKDKVTELHRLFVQDGTPKNTESWFISRALKLLVQERPQIHAVISFADTTEGHYGIVYQASNALFCGYTGKTRFYRDTRGRLRHPRQNGVNIGLEEAKARDWVPEMRGVKCRYLFLTGSKTRKEWSRRHLLLDSFEYPKPEISPSSSDG